MKKMRRTIVGLTLLMALFITAVAFADHGDGNQNFIAGQQNNSSNGNSSNKNKNKKPKKTKMAIQTI